MVSASDNAVPGLESALKNATKDGPKAVLDVLAEPRRTQGSDRKLALHLVELLSDRKVAPNLTAEVFGEIFDAHRDDREVVLALGDAIEAARDIDDLNAAPSQNTLFAQLVTRLTELQVSAADAKEEGPVVEALANTARLMGRQRDDIAARAYARLIELYPEADWAHYGQGLLNKTRGRFEDGIADNQRALKLGSGKNEGHRWNLGICATGAGQAEVALEVWRAIGCKLEIGRFGLPDGGFPACKVRLSQHPLAERDAAQDDPGLEETIWVERLSPCHGIVRSVLYRDLGVDYGDVVLFDGAPITTHLYGDKQIAVFPHMATLRHSGYQFYDFSATQLDSNAVADASDGLAQDAVIYSHTEATVTMCAACFRDETKQHAKHEADEHHVVHGRIAVPPDLAPADLLTQIDAALADISGARLFCPDLCTAAGDASRAAMEARQFATLRAG